MIRTQRFIASLTFLNSKLQFSYHNMYKFGFGIFAEHYMYVLLKIFSHWVRKESSQ